MIISKQKSLDYILSRIGEKSVFIIGCSECATLCQSGGEEEVKQMKNDLEKHDITVTGWIILDPACHLLQSKRLLKQCSQQIQDADTILILACGNGVQTVAELYENKTIISGTNTLFLGEIKRLHHFEKRCNLCGDCIVDQFEGLCPIARCPKHMLNGPCGGTFHGYCEVDKNIPCVWDEIIKKQENNQALEDDCELHPPHDWSKKMKMRLGE